MSKACVTYTSYFVLEPVEIKPIRDHFRVHVSQISKGKHT